ncbi:MAG: histidinol-phosphatase HisJ family protein [Lentisphaeria bacterium]|nr:histidinol-phosphatase HisJ family protein [Lentisphaeria bacterium]
MGFVSYHCHSVWSDGRASIEAMVAAAETAALAEFGLSDHLVLTPYDDSNALEWSMPRNGREVRDCLDSLRRVSEGAALPVRVGVEADYFPETWRELGRLLDDLDLDFVIGSVHYADRFPIDCSARFWAPLSGEQVTAVHRLYWQRVRELAECGLFDIVGHLDLPKKFGYAPETDLSASVDAALDAVAASGMTMELNTAGWDKPCAEAYPSIGLLRAACARGIPVLLSADAHAPGEVARHYARGAAWLRQAGYTEMRVFRNRVASTVRIPDVGKDDHDAS